MEVDQKRTYVLQVTRALYQTLITEKDERPKSPVKESTKEEIEQTDDFKYFIANLG